MRYFTKNTLAASIALSIFTLSSLPAHSQSTALPVAVPSGKILQFSDTPIEDVLSVIYDKTKLVISTDPKVKGTLTWSSLSFSSTDTFLKQFSTALHFHDLALVKIHGKLTIVTKEQAKSFSAVDPMDSGVFATKVFPLLHLSPSDALNAVKPFLSSNNSAVSIATPNRLIISEEPSILERISQMLSNLDTPSIPNLTRLQLQHISPTYALPLLDQLLSLDNQQWQSKVQVLPDLRANSLIVKTSSTAQLQYIQTLLNTIDVPLNTPTGSQGTIYVLPLQNAQAHALAPLLASLFSSTASSGNSTLTAALPGGTSASVNPSSARTNTTSSASNGSSATTLPSGSKIQADPSTNSLIFQGTASEFEHVKKIVNQLDSRRAQVFVESLIVEINTDKAAEFGIQWQTPFGQKGDSVVGLLGTNFGTAGKNIIDLAFGAASGAVRPANGFNFGAAQKLDNGTYVLGALARFLEQQGIANVLSTPTLLTLDNEEAKIIIGQNVPFVTGQFTNTGATNGSVNPFQTIERKDVGLSLKVRPQISAGETVRLQISQEVSSVAPASVNSPTGIITNKRAIDSNVLVEDGSIVALGGLLQEEFSESLQQIPGVSEIPVVGNLFKNQTRDRKKTNLMVFLRPVIIRTAEHNQSFSATRYEQFRNLQLLNAPKPSVITPVNDAPTLPPLSPKVAP